MANAIRDILNAHASIGYSQIEARVRDLDAVYLAARDRLESRIFAYVKEKRASFTGPRLAMLMNELQKEYAGFEQTYSAKLKHSLSYVVNGYYRDAMLHMGLAGNDTIAGGLSKDRIQLMMDDAYSHVAGATRNMSDYSIAQLRRISAQVMREAALTGETRVEVSKRLLASNTAGGWFQFIDRSGRKWTNEAYFDMLGRTLLHNNAREAYLQACADEGSDIVMVSTSGDPCPKCAALEGTLLSISGKTPGLATVADATASGLFHPNCTHRLVAVPESVAEAYFDSKGRPKTGNNSPGNEVYDTPEARKEYRQQQANEVKVERSAKLTPDEVKAVRSYADGAEYRDLNRYLSRRGSGESNPKYDAMERDISAAIDKSTATKTFTVWRGVASAGKREAYKIHPPQEIAVDSFCSTSSTREIAEGFADGKILMKIQVPRGSHALPLNNYSSLTENEVLLKNIGKFKVNKIYYDAKGMMIAEVRYDELG